MKSLVRTELQSLERTPCCLSQDWTVNNVSSDGAIRLVRLNKERWLPYSEDLGSDTFQKIRSSDSKLRCLRAMVRNIPSEGDRRSSFSQPSTFHALTSWLFSRKTYSSFRGLAAERPRKARKYAIHAIFQTSIFKASPGQSEAHANHVIVPGKKSWRVLFDQRSISK